MARSMPLGPPLRAGRLVVLRSLPSRHTLAAVAGWAAAWALTRCAMLAAYGYFALPTDKFSLQDVVQYQRWAGVISGGHLPAGDPLWQYPPLAAGVMVAPPHLTGGPYLVGFIHFMLLCDLLVTAVLLFLAVHTRRWLGVALWIGAMPMMGELLFLRYDVVPTLLVVAGLALLAWPRLAATVLALGALVKVWPVLLFTAFTRPRSLLRAGTVLAAAVLVVAAGSYAMFGTPMGFLHNQASRTLEIESIAATPWVIREVATGVAPGIQSPHGSPDVQSTTANAIARVAEFGWLVSAVAVAVWWWLRWREVRRGRSELASSSLGIDAGLTALLLFLLCSNVLSEQYLIWVLGTAAVAISFPQTRMRRTAGLLVLTVALTYVERPQLIGVLGGNSGAAFALVLRNAAFVLMVAEAVRAMVAVLWPRAAWPGEAERPAGAPAAGDRVAVAPDGLAGL